ncbi:hypothetical protein [Pontibacter russatus]|uniref:hypothetical protein n=1 Tax=Pontibacter russatus TaxID=2694929 RepID=UPI001379BD97|nr:hypothetical protein [Pontibacter russatus]
MVELSDRLPEDTEVKTIVEAATQPNRDTLSEQVGETAEDIDAKYDPAREPIREQNYGCERKLRKYKKKERSARN